MANMSGDPQEPMADPPDGQPETPDAQDVPDAPDTPTKPVGGQPVRKKGARKANGKRRVQTGGASGRNEDVEARAARCVILRRIGMEFADIAASPWPLDENENPVDPENPGRLYQSKQAAYAAYRRAIAATRVTQVNELREEEDDRLRQLLQASMVKAITGDLAAIDRVLRISQQRAALFGLNKPAIGHDHGAAASPASDLTGNDLARRTNMERWNRLLNDRHEARKAGLPVPPIPSEDQPEAEIVPPQPPAEGAASE